MRVYTHTCTLVYKHRKKVYTSDDLLALWCDLLIDHPEFRKLHADKGCDRVGTLLSAVRSAYNLRRYIHVNRREIDILNADLRKVGHITMVRELNKDIHKGRHDYVCKPIGWVFRFRGDKVKVVESKERYDSAHRCKGCVLTAERATCMSRLDCRPHMRDDGKHVIAVKGGYDEA